jgi:hypothetical protein
MVKNSKPFINKNKGKKPVDASALRQKALIFDPPPILIVPRKCEGKEQGEKTKKNLESDLKEIEVMVDPNVKALGTIKRKVPILRNPTPEEWFKWRVEFEEICESKPIPDPRRKALVAPTFLADQAKDAWQRHYRDTVIKIGLLHPVPENENAARKSEREFQMAEEILQETLTACTREFCRVEDPARVQVEYLRDQSYMHGLGVREFANRLKQINDYLPLFPPYELDKAVVQKLRDSELISILIRAKPIGMSIAISKANVSIRKMNFDEVVNYLERLELVSEVQRQSNSKSTTSTSSAQKRNNDKETTVKSPNFSKKFDRKKNPVCSICKKSGHTTDKCWFNKEKGNKPPNNRNPNNKTTSSTERTYTLEEVRQLFDNLPSHQANQMTPRKKRKIVYDSSESEDGGIQNDVHVSDYFRKQRSTEKETFQK